MNPSRYFDVHENISTLSHAHTVIIGLSSNFGECLENGKRLSVPIDNVWQQL
jgi:hypothetical protein